MRISVDLKTCKAYANCMVEAPEYFDFNEETGKVILLAETVVDADRDAVRKAVASCPVQAIVVDE